MTTPNQRPRLARLSEAMTYTAFSRSSIYRAMAANELRFVKMGGSLRFEYAELDRWIDSKAQPDLQK